MHITQSEKEKFLLALNEEEFRDRVIRRLFKALKFTDGRDLCGPEEYGKDCVFVERDKFGDEAIIAVQTKQGAITLAGDPSKNLHTILAQLRTALNEPYICVREKQKKLPAVVYLAASGRINDKARGHIQENISDPRLKFLDRDDLITKIDETCPEIWSGIASEISPYLKALADKVDSLSISAQDVNPAQSALGAFAAASDHAFVDVTLAFQDLVIETRSGTKFEDVKLGEIKGTQLFRANGARALVLGDAGSGKTTLMIRLAYMLAKDAVISTKAYRIPIYLRAYELVNSSESVFGTLAELVVKNNMLNALPFDIEDFSEGRIVLLVDGLDELSDSADRQTVIDFCLRFTGDYPKCSLALTTRPYSSVDRLSGVQKFKRFRVTSLSMKDASKILSNLEKGNGGDLDWRRETLRKLEGVHGVELNPLLVTVFAVSSRMEKRDVPANITELFSKFTELMLGRWDERKGLSQQYQAKLKEALLSEFAFKLHQSGESGFTRSEFEEFASSRLREMNLEADLPIIVSEILDRSGLLRGDSEVEFRHHLLQEYFAAKGIPGVEFVRGVVGNDWWRNSIVFYFGASPSSVDQLLDIATVNSYDPADSFVSVGLALQACYLSNMEERIDVWKWVNGAAGHMLATIADENSVDEKYPVTNFLASYLEGRDALALSGVEDSRFEVAEWCNLNCGAEERERRAFWYAVSLIEIGAFDSLRTFLENKFIAAPLLLTALHLGCHFSLELKSVSSEQLECIESIIHDLEPIVAGYRFRIAEECRGQLLEYRHGGVVALDEAE